MEKYTVNNEFWNVLDDLVTNSEIVIDRPKGTIHPKYPSLVYVVDYGYLKGSSSMVCLPTSKSPRLFTMTTSIRLSSTSMVMYTFFARLIIMLFGIILAPKVKI